MPESTTTLSRLAGKAILPTLILLLAAVPLTFTTAVHRIYVAPRFAILLIGSAMLLVEVTALATSPAGGREAFSLLRSRHTAIVLLYFICIAISTASGVSPLASLFGSFDNQMGLVTYFCFILVFIGLVLAIGRNERGLVAICWAMALAGLAAGAYATVQFFGYDPFVSSSLYTFSTPTGPILRVIGPIGHSNYLGNFLLYTTPIATGLAFGSQGQSRRIAAAAAVVSLAAIAFSGTRGAWLGCMAGVCTFAALESSRILSRLSSINRRRRLLLGAIGTVVIAVTIGLIASLPASRGLLTRARSLIGEGFTGSGRTLLWRDSSKMLLRYALVGCGPEGYREAFLRYKSVQVARLAPQINNESSHNSYLDAAISYGVPGGILYIAILASSFLLLLKSRRQATATSSRMLLSGLLASLAAVATHNFFIFDQMPTGLYFFALAGMALAATNAMNRTSHPETKSRPAKSKRSRKSPVMQSSPAQWIAVLASGTAAAVVVWNVVGMLRADAATKSAFVVGSEGDFNGLRTAGTRATAGPDPTGAYGFMFARALALYIDRVRGQAQLDQTRAEAAELGITHARRSLSGTFAPDSVNLLMAYLAYSTGDSAAARTYAEEALKWDPHYPNTHWLLAEALLSGGDADGAAREAQLALDIYPSFDEARDVLRRARGERNTITPDDRLSRARALIAERRLKKAERVLKRALRITGGRCPDCHRELALLYEESQQYDLAISEWQAYQLTIGANTDAGRNADDRIRMLKEKIEGRRRGN
ncbi:MAG TPA: O-antigen ligase family protein [Blastocatellia bacterium]|nr:O-antigen ligase family protein [Blastocatellia bacterium]